MATSLSVLQARTTTAGTTYGTLVPLLRALLLDTESFAEYNLLQSIDAANDSLVSGTDEAILDAAFLLITGAETARATFDGAALAVALNEARMYADDTNIDPATGDDRDFKYPDSQYSILLALGDSAKLVGNYMKESSGGATRPTSAIINSLAYKVREYTDDVAGTDFTEVEISSLLFAGYNQYAAAIELLIRKIKDLSSNNSSEVTSVGTTVSISGISVTPNANAFESKSQVIGRYNVMIKNLYNQMASDLKYGAFFGRSRTSIVPNLQSGDYTLS